MNVAQKIASLIAARANCLKSGNQEWHERHGEALTKLVNERMPSGSGFDTGTVLLEEKCQGGARLVFGVSFHHMSEHGYYDGWTEHTVTVRPSFVFDFEMAVTGRNRNDIRDYIAEAFSSALGFELHEDARS